MKCWFFQGNSHALWGLCSEQGTARLQPTISHPQHILVHKQTCQGNSQEEVGSASGDPGNPFPKGKYLKSALDKNPLGLCPLDSNEAFSPPKSTDPARWPWWEEMRGAGKPSWR